MRIPTLTSRWQVRDFLETVGYCRLWILGFAEKVQSLYKLTKEQPALQWEDKHQKAFADLKAALSSAPALAFPDLAKPSILYVSERHGMMRGKGVMTQRLGPWERPVAYLSKKLDSVVARWPACL